MKIRKKSSKVSVTLLTALAALFISSCKDEKKELLRCVDDKNLVVADSLCGCLDENNKQTTGSHGAFIYPYHWYFGGAGYYNNGAYYASGGSMTAQSGVTYTSSSGVSRGGFGSTGVGHSSGT